MTAAEAGRGGDGGDDDAGGVAEGHSEDDPGHSDIPIWVWVAPFASQGLH